MFSSTPLNPRTEGNKINFSLNATSSDVVRGISANKPISTPLPRKESLVTTPTRSNHALSRRYSLSDVHLTPAFQTNGLRQFKNQPPQGSPVMSNGRYNVNTSTYLESRSPGYVGRMVRYNEEREKSLPTHHPKYNIPGIFPIVHLFKKDLPVLKRKPSKVTVRIASPELSRYNTPEHNRMLLEKIVHPNAARKVASPKVSEVNTKSVLDALKEISRKRIHSNEEEFEIQDDGKRIRMDCVEAFDGKKRSRADDSPTAENSTSPLVVTKKMCCLNDVLASHTSMEGQQFEEPKKGGSKVITSSMQKTTRKEVKKTKLVDVETQTILPDVPSPVQSTTEVKKPESKNISTTVKCDDEAFFMHPKKPSPIKVFDEKPLEMMRKNRLSALMGSLTDTKNATTKVSENKPETAKVPELVSILSSVHKPHHDKHVTFNLPENDDSITTKSIDLPIDTNQLDASLNTNADVTQTSTAILTPIVSSSESPNSNRPDQEKLQLKISSPPTSISFAIPTTQNQQVTQNKVSAEISNQNTPQFSFGVTKSPPSFEIKGNHNIAKSESVAISTAASNISFNFGTTTQNTIPSQPTSLNFAFGPKPVTPATSQLTINSQPTVTSSTNKPIGGFKFDLNKPISTSLALPPFSNSVSSTNDGDDKPAAPTFVIAGTNPDSAATATNLNSSTMFFPKITTASNTSGNFMFSPAATTINVTAATGSKPFIMGSATAPGGNLPSFSFTSTATPFAPSVSAVVTTTSAMSSSNAPTFSFMGNTPVSSFSNATSTFTIGNSAPPSFGVSTASSTLSLGVVTAVTTAPPFGSSLNQTNKPPIFAFGPNNTQKDTSTPSVFGNNDKPVAFGVITTTTSTFFGSTNATVAVPSFGMQTTQSFTSPISSTPFNTSKTSFPSTNNSFGNVFEQNKTTSANIFRPNATVAAAPPNVFGTVNPVTTTPANVFGPNAATTTPANVFGPNAATTTPANVFGPNATTTTSANVFGANNIVGSTNNPPPFGPVTTASFGAGNNMFSGNNQQTPGFGAVSNANPAKPIFGSTKAPINFGVVATAPPPYGSTNSFATATTTSGMFGGTPSFGVTTTATPAFGTNAAPTFGTSNNFGSNQFGSNSPLPTRTNTASFGNKTTLGTVPAGVPSTAFDSPQNFSSPPAFGSAPPNFNQANNGFGSGFGNTAPPSFEKPPETNNAFGSTNAFGAKPSTFGNSSFSTSTPTTTQGGVFTFGSNTTATKPGVFSFGPKGSEPPKPPFNFTPGGSNNPPAFGAANANFGNGTNAFGAAPAPQFNAPPTAPGMFSIGSGSATPNRSRTQLKAKRRT